HTARQVQKPKQPCACRKAADQDIVSTVGVAEIVGSLRVRGSAAPGVQAIGGASGCRVLPLGISGQTTTVPGAEGKRGVPAHAVDGAVLGRLAAWRVGPGCEVGVALERGPEGVLV